MIKKSIRKYCYWCSGNQSKEIKLCPASDCPLHTLREGGKPSGLNRLRSISLRCLDCKGGLKIDVNKCDDTSCPLFPYRMGKNPARSGIGNKDIKRYSNFKNKSLSNV